MEVSSLTNFAIGMLAILNPLGNIPIFVSYTEGEKIGVRRALALLISAVIFGLLVLFLFTGQGLLSAFGITLPAFRIAGGILVLLMGIHMIQGSDHRKGQTTQENDSETNFERAAQELNKILVPVAVPMFVGPGSISAVILYSEQAKNHWDLLLMTGILATICLMVSLSLLASEWIQKILGKNGLAIATRLMGLILCAVAVQFMINGLAEATTDFINPKVVR